METLWVRNQQGQYTMKAWQIGRHDVCQKDRDEKGENDESLQQWIELGSGQQSLLLGCYEKTSIAQVGSCQVEVDKSNQRETCYLIGNPDSQNEFTGRPCNAGVW